MLALKSLKDPYGDQKVTETYEKVKHIYTIPELENLLEIDLSVINENKYVTESIKILKQSIQQKINVSFDYTNSQNNSSLITADILHVYYKWYAWYAFGYNCNTKMFRMYKISRMQNLQLNDACWLQEYPIEEALKTHEKDRNKNNISVIVEYHKEVETLFLEYFPTSKPIKCKETTIISEFIMKSNDLILFSILLGFGTQVKVLSPASFALRIQNHLQQSLNFYKNSDS